MLQPVRAERGKDRAAGSFLERSDFSEMRKRSRDVLAHVVGVAVKAGGKLCDDRFLSGLRLQAAENHIERFVALNKPVKGRACGGYKQGFFACVVHHKIGIQLHFITLLPCAADISLLY